MFGVRHNPLDLDVEDKVLPLPIFFIIKAIKVKHLFLNTSQTSHDTNTQLRCYADVPNITLTDNVKGKHGHGILLSAQVPSVLTLGLWTLDFGLGLDNNTFPNVKALLLIQTC